MPAHDMEATIARLSTGREDVRVHDEAVVEYCIDRLLATNDGGEECLDSALAPGCEIIEVPLSRLGLEDWVKDPGTEDEAQRTSCDYVVPPDCSGEQLDDRVLFLHVSCHDIATIWVAFFS